MVRVREATLRGQGAWSRAASMGLLLALALLIPGLGLPQMVTGPLVNALLLLSVNTAGVSAAIAVGMVSPLAGALYGVLPLPLLVMMPFIALGNAALVSLYGALRGKHFWLAVTVGAVAKFALLFGAVSWLAREPLMVAAGGAAQPVVLPASLAHMMQWPQLATALAGGAIVFMAQRAIRRPLTRDTAGR